MTRPAALIAAELGAEIASNARACSLLAELIESLDRPRTSMDASSDAIIAERRAADRARQKAKRDQLKAEKSAKQTMGGSSSDVPETSMDASKDKGLPSCDLLSSSLSTTEVQGSKKVVVERVRATRLSQGMRPSTVDRYFAAAAGIPEAEIDRVWDEFVDYWSAVPGQRGTKLKWDATWRNRVRTLTPWKGHTNGARPRTLADAGRDLIARTAEFDLADGPVVEHDPQ